MQVWVVLAAGFTFLIGLFSYVYWIFDSPSPKKNTNPFDAAGIPDDESMDVFMIKASRTRALYRRQKELYLKLHPEAAAQLS